MPAFRYRALDPKGQEVTGLIEASSVASALDELHAKGFVPFEANPEDGASKSIWTRDLLGGDRLGRTEGATFMRELATLICATVPLDEALQSIADQSGTSKSGTLARKLVSHLREGLPLSEAMERENAFSASDWSLIRAGETGGTLGTVLTQAADIQERENKIRSDVQSALFYPAILLLLSGAAFVFILTVLLPSLQPVFEDAGAALPPMTRFLLDTGLMLQANWPGIVIGLCVFAVLVVHALRRETVRTRLDTFFLHVPLIGPIVTKTETTRFARTLGMLLKNGCTMTTALSIVESAAGNRRFAGAIAHMRQDIKEGQAFVASLERTDVFPPLVRRLAAAGDRAGTLDTMLLRTSDILEFRVKRDIDRVVGMLTPIITVIIGLMIGGLVISVLSAVLSVNDLAV